MCRPCTSIEESAVIPQEIVNYADEAPISGHFAKPEWLEEPSEMIEWRERDANNWSPCRVLLCGKLVY